MARAPKTFNFFINQPLMRKLSEKHIGMVDLPLLSVPSLQQQMVGHRSANMTLEQLEALNAEQKARTVLVVQDPFTSYYDAQVVADFVRLVEKLGFQPVLLPFSPNGKAQHIKGFLNRFAKTAKKTADFLNRMAKLGMPMVGVDPALVLCYRDEYKLALGENVASLTSYWRMNGWQAHLSHSQWLQSAVNHGISLVTVPKLPPCRVRQHNGPRYLPVLARNWKMSAWVAAAWQGLTDMKRKTIKIRSGSMSYPGIRLCSDCRVTAVWRPDIPAVVRSNGLKARGYAILCRLYWRLLNDMETKNHPGSTECHG